MSDERRNKVSYSRITMCWFASIDLGTLYRCYDWGDMMIVEVIKCDICHKELDYGDAKTEISYRNGRYAHLCRPCTYELNCWLVEKRKEMLMRDEI